jgi:hypothetical protein
MLRSIDITGPFPTALAAPFLGKLAVSQIEGVYMKVQVLVCKPLQRFLVRLAKSVDWNWKFEIDACVTGVTKLSFDVVILTKIRHT